MKLQLAGYKTILLSSAVIFSITGCGPKVKLSEYKQAPINKCAIMPTAAELAHVKPKVVVMPLNNGSTDILKKVNAGKTIADGTEAILTSSKLVQLVDRNAAKKLADELSLIEMKGTSGKKYKGPDIANLAVTGTLNSASVKSQFSEAKTYCNEKTGKCTTYPATCSYTGSISGTLKIYELPDLRVVDSFPIDGSSSFSEEGHCKSNFDQEGLILNASVKAPSTAKVSLLNQFSPKGYITERRDNDGKSIFLAQVGAQDGATYNLKIKLYALRSNTNPLTNITTTEEVFLGEAKVSDQITPNTAWIYVDDKDVANQIMLGDYVKFDFQKGFVDLFI